MLGADGACVDLGIASLLAGVALFAGMVFALRFLGITILRRIFPSLRRESGIWLATGFNIGIGTGGGSAQYLANWMNDGSPAYDLPIIYPSRYSNDISKKYALSQIRATYARGYVMPQVAA